MGVANLIKGVMEEKCGGGRRHGIERDVELKEGGARGRITQRALGKMKGIQGDDGERES